ncbi:hypothetical protein MPHL43070_11535 [Mycolicibacterium phlei DSM 43070]|nr:hypothetical protein MPHL43070_11535 [Mycolicibacterium phlei DSM 43070]
MQFPAAFGVRHPGRVTAEPVGGLLLAVLVAGHDLQTAPVQVTRLVELDRLAQHPLRAGSAVGDVADRADGARGADVAGAQHPGGVVEQHAQRGGGGRCGGGQRRYAGAHGQDGRRGESPLEDRSPRN